MAQSQENVRPALIRFLDDAASGLTTFARDTFAELYEQLTDLDSCIERVTHRVERVHRAHPVCQKLAAVPGIGPLTATVLMAAGSTADDPQLQSVDGELTAIDKTYGTVSIAPRSKRSGKEKEGEPFGLELVPAAMPFAGDQRVSIEHARAQILESGSFSGLLPAGAYTLGNQTFTVIAGTNISGVLWGE